VFSIKRQEYIQRVDNCLLETNRREKQIYKKENGSKETKNLEMNFR